MGNRYTFKCRFNLPIKEILARNRMALFFQLKGIKANGNFKLKKNFKEKANTID
jgi:hypothetical protein